MFQVSVPKHLKKLGIILLCSIIFLRFNNLSSEYKDEKTTINGIVNDYKIDGDLLNLIVNAKEKIQVFYTIKTIEEKEKLTATLKYGTKITLKGEITTPQENKIPNTFNYKNYLKSINIYKILNAEEITIYENNNILYKIKNYLIKEDITKTNSYMNALIFANQDLIPDDIKESYQINGISHLLAISGMHIALLCIILKKLLSKIKFSKIIIYIFLIIYLIITNFPPSLLRATTFYLMLDIFSKYKIKTINIFIYTVLIILVINPNLLLNLGFQYSVVTTYFLIHIKINNKYKLIKISILAFISSLPITINNFYEFNILSPLLNIIFVPLVSIIIYPLTLLTYIFNFLEPVYLLFITAMEKLSLNLSDKSLIINIPKIPIFIIIIYYVILIIYKKINYKIILIISCLLIITKILPLLDTNGYVYYLNVGQGDSSIIISPNVKDKILIDSGGIIEYEKEKWQERKKINNGKNIAVFLKSLGITSLDLVILSHGDIDHVKDMKEIEKYINFKNVMINKDDINNYEIDYKNYQNNYTPKNITFNILNQKLYDNENDNSIINLIKIYNTNLLFTGDISKNVELEIINKYNINNIDILKIGHHGSNTSSDEKFIKTTNPTLSIISSGLNNRFNHPDQEVLDTLNEYNIPYLNTAYENTISIEINKKGYTILK